jgi:hypothetical protein
MKKTAVWVFVLVLGMAFQGFAQTASPQDFFADKWEILIMDTPDGNKSLVADLIRKDGKLTGQLREVSNTSGDGLPISNVEEDEKTVKIFFEAQGMDINIHLEKVDQDNLRGSLLGMFDATATRVKKEK